jgi:hypothetical protein
MPPTKFIERMTLQYLKMSIVYVEGVIDRKYKIFKPVAGDFPASMRIKENFLPAKSLRTFKNMLHSKLINKIHTNIVHKIILHLLEQLLPTFSYFLTCFLLSMVLY